MEPKEEHDGHLHIVCIITAPRGLLIGYEHDKFLFAEYGGMRFDYCPLCGRKKKEGK